MIYYPVIFNYYNIKLNIFKAKYRFATFLSAFLMASVLFCLPIHAQYYSQGGNSPSVTIDKKVRPITSDKFYDNIDAKDKVFVENEQIEFQIVVMNNSNQALYNLEFKDILPDYISLLFYPGIYYKSGNYVKDEITQLGVGESKVFLVRGYISNSPTTTLAKKDVLQINKAYVSNNLVSDSDQAQYFIEAKNVPGTGADDLGLKTMTVLLVAISAYSLRKLARGY